MSARRVYPVYPEQRGELNRRFTLRLTEGGFALPLIIIAILLPIILLAWAPWVTDGFALNKLKTYSPCPQLAVVPDFTTPASSQKVPFGRKLIKTESACGTYDLFVSALGTVHQIKFYKLSESKAPDPTIYTDKGSANWKTYTNTQYGFLIKYPETLVPTVFGNASELFTIPITENDRIEIETIGSIEPFDLNDEMNNDLQRRGDPEKINFHNKPAVLTRYTVKQTPKPPVIPYMAVFVYLEDKKSKIVLGYYGDGSNELLFNQILSTFKFIQ